MLLGCYIANQLAAKSKKLPESLVSGQKMLSMYEYHLNLILDGVNECLIPSLFQSYTHYRAPESMYTVELNPQKNLHKILKFGSLIDPLKKLENLFIQITNFPIHFL